MKNINYALAGGNKTLVTVQATDRTMALQLWFSGIVATTVTVEVWVSTDGIGPFTKIPDGTITLVPADGTAVLTLQGLSYLFTQFRLVTGGVTVGTIDRIDVLNGANDVYDEL